MLSSGAENDLIVSVVDVNKAAYCWTSQKLMTDTKCCTEGLDCSEGRVHVLEACSRLISLEKTVCYCMNLGKSRLACIHQIDIRSVPRYLYRNRF